MSTAIGMNVLAFDPFPDATLGANDSRFRYTSLEEVVSRSDVLSLHSPAPDSDQPMIDAARIGSMKRGVYIVNTARGELLDDAAVLTAADAGKVQAYITDFPTRAQAPADEIAAHVKANLAAYKVPREIVFLDALPRNATGKVLKRELRGEG